MRLRLKAQSSVEFISMIAIGMALTAPFIIILQGNIIDLQQDTRNAEFSSSVDEMINAIQKSEALGEKAESDFTLNIPNNVQDAYIRGDFVIFEKNLTEPTNITRSFNINSSVIGNLPSEQGDHFGKAYNNGTHIELIFSNSN